MLLINEFCKQSPLQKLKVLAGRFFGLAAGFHTRKNTLRLVLSFVLPCFILFIHGCSKQEDSGGGLPPVLKIGLLPHESKAILIKHYTPLFQYLSEELDVQYELIIPSGYEDLLRQFDEGEIDLAFFGGFTFIQANKKSGAVPLVMRDVDVHFTSYLISSTSKPEKRLEDFKGKEFAFGAVLSTSGHIMPRYFLEQKNLIPEVFFNKVAYSGSHDKTVLWVRDGVVDIGAVNAGIIEEMILDDRLNHNDIRIILETPPYSNYVWAAQENLNQSSQNKIRQAFLSLTPVNDIHASILSGVNAGGFLPASMNDFTKLQQIALNKGSLNSIHDSNKD